MPQRQIHTWHHTHLETSTSYLISTDLSLVNRQWLNDAFTSQDMYWAKALPSDQMEAMLASSLNIGLYKLPESSPDIAEPSSTEEPSSPRTPSPTLENRSCDGTALEASQTEAPPQQQLEQVGYARLITDFVTTAYLTDVYISPSSRGLGLAKHLMRAVRESIERMPAMRRGFLVASPGVGEKFYQRELGFWDVKDESHHLVLMTKRFFKLEGEGH